MKKQVKVKAFVKNEENYIEFEQLDEQKKQEFLLKKQECFIKSMGLQKVKN